MNSTIEIMQAIVRELKAQGWVGEIYTQPGVPIRLDSLDREVRVVVDFEEGQVGIIRYDGHYLITGEAEFRGAMIDVAYDVLVNG